MPETKRLLRSRSDRKIAGVCAGIATYFEVDATLVRVLYAVISLFAGVFFGGVLLYLVLAIIIPEEP